MAVLMVPSSFSFSPSLVLSYVFLILYTNVSIFMRLGASVLSVDPAQIGKSPQRQIPLRGASVEIFEFREILHPSYNSLSIFRFIYQTLLLYITIFLNTLISYAYLARSASLVHWRFQRWVRWWLRRMPRSLWRSVPLFNRRYGSAAAFIPTRPSRAITPQLAPSATTVDVSQNCMVAFSIMLLMMMIFMLSHLYVYLTYFD